MLCFTLLWTTFRTFLITRIYRSRNSRNLQAALWECNQQLQGKTSSDDTLCLDLYVSHVWYFSYRNSKTRVWFTLQRPITLQKHVRLTNHDRTFLLPNSPFLGHKLTLFKDTNMFILCANSRANSEVNILKSLKFYNHITDNLKLMGWLGRKTAFPPWITLCNELKNFRARIKHKTMSAKPDLFLTCKDDCQKVKEPQHRHQ